MQSIIKNLISDLEMNEVTKLLWSSEEVSAGVDKIIIQVGECEEIQISEDDLQVIRIKWGISSETSNEGILDKDLAKKIVSQSSSYGEELLSFEG